MDTLQQMKPGTRCTVKKVHGEGATYQRLLEMGLIEGTVVEVIRLAPLGDPMEVNLHGFNLSLRAREAEKVEVINV